MSPLIGKERFDEACRDADIAMKESGGHVFEHILKSRCIWCGRSPRAKGRCRGWFNTFLWHLSGDLTGTFGAPRPAEGEKHEHR